MKKKIQFLKKKTASNHQITPPYWFYLLFKNRFESPFYIQRKLTYVARKNGFPTGGWFDVRFEILLLYRKVFDGTPPLITAAFCKVKVDFRIQNEQWLSQKYDGKGVTVKGKMSCIITGLNVDECTINLLTAKTVVTAWHKQIISIFSPCLTK